MSGKQARAIRQSRGFLSVLIHPESRIYQSINVRQKVAKIPTGKLNSAGKEVMLEIPYTTHTLIRTDGCGYRAAKRMNSRA